MEREQSSREHEVAQALSPSWLGAYRLYLYLALALSVLSAVRYVFNNEYLWSEQISVGLQIRLFTEILISILFFAYLPISLKRIGETWVTILHSAVNGVALFVAIVYLFGNYYYLLTSWWFKLLQLFTVKLVSYIIYVEVFFGRYAALSFALAIVLVSVLWLWKWYKYSGWSFRHSHLWYILRPFVLTSLVVVGITSVLFLLSVWILPGIANPLILSIGAIPIGAIPIAISALISWFRVFKWLWRTIVGTMFRVFKWLWRTIVGTMSKNTSKATSD